MLSGWILVTNDDGIASPALRPLALALKELAPVRVVVPNGERSWSGKALSKTTPISVERISSEAFELVAHSGTPADGVQLAVHHLFDDPPSLIVSGINLGFNYGSAYAWSSGTLGAAIEGSIAGVPSIAVSTGSLQDWAAWRTHAESPDSLPEWRALAGLTTDIVRDITTTDLLRVNDVVSVNMTFDATLADPRSITHTLSTRYGGMLSQLDDGRFEYSFGGGLVGEGPSEGSDIGVVADGGIAITPIDMAGHPTASQAARNAIERP